MPVKVPGQGLRQRCRLVSGLLPYLKDANPNGPRKNFNTAALVQGTPEHADLGKVVERYLYDPYGKVTVLDGDPSADADGGGVTEWAPDTVNASDWGNAVLYCGYRYDAETGLYHVRHRMYHPTLGRWLQRDPLGYVDGISLYEYCASQPVSLSDPLGEKLVVETKGKAGTYNREKGCGAVQETMERLMPGSEVEVNRETGEVNITKPPTPATEKMCPAEREKAEAAERIYRDYRKIIDDPDHTLRVEVDYSTKKGGYTPDDEFSSRMSAQGTSGTVTWDPKHCPQVERTSNGKVVKDRALPEEVFHHEATHGRHGMQGTRDKTPTTVSDAEGRKHTMSKEEATTIGVGHTRGGESTEHDASEVLGKDPRASHWSGK